MENYQAFVSPVATPAGPLKDSIRDMVRIQDTYQLSDELFWEVFNARVLLNQPIDINDFITHRVTATA